MTKEYEEYKSEKGKHKAVDVLIKMLGIIVAVGLVLLAVMFSLMLLFPARCGEGWIGLFKSSL